MKIWKISCCEKCPANWTVYNIRGDYDFCHRENRRIKLPNKLPSWCTLPDYEEDK